MQPPTEVTRAGRVAQSFQEVAQGRVGQPLQLDLDELPSPPRLAQDDFQLLCRLVVTVRTQQPYGAALD